MNRSLQVSCLIATLLTQVNEARADGADVQNIPAGKDIIVPVRKGEPSPIDGQVFDNDTALRWANWLVQYKSLVRIDAEYQKKICAVDTALAEKKLQIQEQQYEVVTKDLQKKLTDAQKEAADPAFYRTFWFGATVGVATTVALTVAAAVVLNSTH
jgi:hypothetical protein